MKLKNIIISLLTLTLTGCGSFDFAGGQSSSIQTPPQSSSSTSSSSSSSSSSPQQSETDLSGFTVINDYIFYNAFYIGENIGLEFSLDNNMNPSTELGFGKLEISSENESIMSIDNFILVPKKEGETYINISYSYKGYTTTLKYKANVLERIIEKDEILKVKTNISDLGVLVPGRTHEIQTEIVLADGKSPKDEYEQGRLMFYTSNDNIALWDMYYISLYNSGVVDLFVSYNGQEYYVESIFVSSTIFSYTLQTEPNTSGVIEVEKDSVFTIDINLDNSANLENEYRNDNFKVYSFDTNIIELSSIVSNRLVFSVKNPGNVRVEISYGFADTTSYVFFFSVIEEIVEEPLIGINHIATNISSLGKLFPYNTYDINLDVILANGKTPIDEFMNGKLTLWTSDESIGAWDFEHLTLFKPGKLDLYISYDSLTYLVESIVVTNTEFEAIPDMKPDKFGNIEIQENTTFNIKVDITNGSTLENEINSSYFFVNSSNSDVVEIYSINENIITFLGKATGVATITLEYGQTTLTAKEFNFVVAKKQTGSDLDQSSYLSKVLIPDAIDEDAGADAFSLWSAGTCFHDETGWKIGNGWRTYLIFDSKGDLAYGVANPSNGYGGPAETSYMRHSKYANYEDNPAIRILDGYGPWEQGSDAHTKFEIIVPNGGFAITSHGDATPILIDYVLGYEMDSMSDSDINTSRSVPTCKAYRADDNIELYYPRFFITKNTESMLFNYNEESQAYELKNLHMTTWNSIKLYYNFEPLILENLTLTGYIYTEGYADWTEKLYFEDIESNVLICSYSKTGTVNYNITYYPSTNTLHVDAAIIETR